MRHIDALIFDPMPLSGHHAEHIKYLVERWVARNTREVLGVAVSGESLRHHPDLYRLLLDDSMSNLVETLCLETKEKLRSFERLGTAIAASFRYGRLLAGTLRKLRVNRCFLPYFDSYQIPLALGLRFPFPLKLSGVYFRPTFHYLAIGAMGKRRDFLHSIRQRALLAAAMRNPHLEQLFCFDPYSVPYVQALNRRVRVSTLPDPVVLNPGQVFSRVEQLPGNETVRFLMFGMLSKRKGVFELLRALRKVDDDIARKIHVVFAGEIEAGDRDEFVKAYRSVKDSAVELVLHDRFLSDEEVTGLFRSADIVLLPYQGHAGSSGVLLRAAAAGKPVIGAEYGLVGQLISNRKLGIAIDCENPGAIARAIQICVSGKIGQVFDRDAALQFARENSASRYAEIILDQLRTE